MAPNRLQRAFAVPQPNRGWVGDITFIPTRAGWLHVAVLVDLFARRVVGWAMSADVDGALVTQAVETALTRRAPRGLTAPDVLGHSVGEERGKRPWP